ncbi:hypothetical protein OC861_002979 [Tilletia horrida]|nr:hypothetical protein OC861_002979 [Tilletia horrida]
MREWLEILDHGLFSAQNSSAERDRPGFRRKRVQSSGKRPKSASGSSISSQMTTPGTITPPESVTHSDPLSRPSSRGSGVCEPQHRASQGPPDSASPKQSFSPRPLSGRSSPANAYEYPGAPLSGHPTPLSPVSPFQSRPGSPTPSSSRRQSLSGSARERKTSFASSISAKLSRISSNSATQVNQDEASTPVRRGSAPVTPSTPTGPGPASTEHKPKSRPRPILISSASNVSAATATTPHLQAAQWSLPTPTVTLPSPSWLTTLPPAANAAAAAAAAFVVPHKTSLRSTTIDNWCRWDAIYAPSYVSDSFHSVSELVTEVGPVFGSILRSVKVLLRGVNVDKLRENGVVCYSTVHRILASVQSIAAAIAASQFSIEEGSATAVCIALLNSQILELQGEFSTWSKWSGASVIRHREELIRQIAHRETSIVEVLHDLLTIVTMEVLPRVKGSNSGLARPCINALAEAQKHIKAPVSSLLSKNDDFSNVKSLVVSERGRVFFRSLARGLRTVFHSNKSPRLEDDFQEFRLPSAAMSPVHQLTMLPEGRDSFTAPPVEATAKELTRRLDALDDLYQTLTLDSPAVGVRASIASEETGTLSEVDADSDLDSLHGGEEPALVKSPRIGTRQMVSLVDDLISHLEKLAPRALAQKLHRLVIGLNTSQAFPEVAVHVASMEVALYRKQSLLDTPAGRGDLINALDNLATSLEILERYEEAVTLTEEMINHIRVLREERSTSLQATVGVTLGKLTRRLAMTGRFTDAQRTAEEALSVFQALDVDDHRRYKSELATALFNKAACLHLLGKKQPALASCYEALSLRRAACHYPGSHHQETKALSESLLQLSELFSEDNASSRSLEAATEAAKMMRFSNVGSEHSSDISLAYTLLCQAARLRERSQTPQATKVMGDAVAILRQLSHHQPDRFSGAFGRALCRLGQDELDGAPHENLASRDSPALLTFAEASMVLRPLGETVPAEFGSDLAKALLAYSTCLGAAGRDHESASVARQSLQALQLLSQPTVSNEDDHVKALIRLTASLARAGSPQEGYMASKELVAMQRKRATLQPEEFQADLARALCNHSFFLDGIGKPEYALQACEESVEVLKAAVARDGRLTRSELGLATRQLSGRLLVSGDVQRALLKMQEAVELLRGASDRSSGFILNPTESEVSLGRSLRDLAKILSSLGRYEQSVIVVSDSVRVFRTLEAMDPGAHMVDLARSVNEQSNRLAEMNAHKDAAKAAKEAVVLWQRIVSAHPRYQRYLPDLAFSRWALARRLSDLERFDDAVKAIYPAVSILHDLAKSQPERWQTHLEGIIRTQTHVLHEAGQPLRAFSRTRDLKRLLSKHSKAEPK